VSVQKALQIIGFNDSESRIIEYMLNKDECTAEEIIEGTGLSRGTVYRALSSLNESSRITKSNTRPVIYVITSGLTEEIKKEFSNFYKAFEIKMERRKFRDERKLYNEIYISFEKCGFAIRNVPLIKQIPGPFKAFPIPDKIADAEYSIAIFVIDKNKKIDIKYPIMFYVDNILRYCRTLNCITAFLFIHSDIKNPDKLYNMLSNAINNVREIWSSRPFYEGIEGNEIFIFRTTSDIDSQIINSIRNIRQRNILIRDLVSKLKEKIEINHELILLSQEHNRFIDEFLIKTHPFSTYKSVKEGIKEITEPIQKMKNRESRNLSIFRRRFSENEVRINQYIDGIESRDYLPLIDRIENDLKELSQIESKFKPIEYELNYIRQGLFKYALELSKIEDRSILPKINPFLFTEPYEKTPFYVNQQKLEKAAHNLRNSILEESPRFFQILCGEAGIGKTHALNYIYRTIMEDKGIKTLYVDCPVSYDLFAGVFQELTQESLYPSEVSQNIRNLRRITPTVTRDFIRVFSEISEIWKSLGYSGVLIILDELENSLPYIIRTRVRAPIDVDTYSLPIALRQIRELFIYDRYVKNMGFIIACRSRIMPLIKIALDIDNIDEFIFQPKKLSDKEFISLIKHRYDMWHINNPIFKEDAIKAITKKTKRNTRNVIKYSRALYEFAIRNKKSVITNETVTQIGPIPLFIF